MINHYHIIITYYYISVVNHYCKFIITYYYVIITSLLHHYYVIITLLLQMAKLCKNGFIISYFHIGCFYYHSIITIITIITYYYVFESEQLADGVPGLSLTARVRCTFPIQTQPSCGWGLCRPAIHNH